MMRAATWNGRSLNSEIAAPREIPSESQA
ncbi:MAG TPA: hypothetical protein DCW71_04690 [Alistipes sp.]|nr:hypothetical protein [Alistipes sp.]